MFEPTNTLSSVSFDILKMDGVEDPMININKLATMDIEESYLALSVDFINECNKELTNHKFKFYKSLNEACVNESDTMVLESFSEFFSGVKDIIEKFIKFIRKMVDKFIVTLHNIVKSESYLKKHKDDFTSNMNSVEFTINGYNYTFSPMVPLATAALSYNNSLFDDLHADTNNILTTNSVKSSIDTLNLEDDYDYFRAKVLNIADGSVILMSEFSDALFEAYRNGYRDTEDIDVDSTYIRRAYDRFENYSKFSKEVDKQRRDMEKAYERVQKQVEDIVKGNSNLDKQAFLSRLPAETIITDIETSGSGVIMSAELMTQIDVYVKAKVEQIQEYTNIHTLAFGAKLNAMKDCLNQDKAVLYTALSKTKEPLKKGVKR